MIERTLFSAEHEAFRDSFRRFMDKEIAPFHAEWEEQGYVDREVWRKAGANGFLCMTMPEAYGGGGADKLYSVVQMEELSRGGFSGLGFGLHSEIVAPYILHYGSEAQKRKYLPLLASGETIGAIAMSEPAAGSDLQGVKSTALRKTDSQGEHYLLNGSKTFITNGWHADLVIVVAKTDPSKRHDGISLLLVEASTPGFRRGRNLEKIGLKGQDTSELFFEDCRVPVANLLGQEGGGFRMLMQNLQQERLCIAVSSMASVRRSLDDTIAYVKERRAFGKPIAAFQNTQFKLAELETEYEIGQAFSDRLLAAHVRGEDIVKEVSMAKWWCSDLQKKVAIECLQLFGGMGFMEEMPISTDYCDAAVQSIYAGSNEIMKVIIARRMGLDG